MFVLLAGKNAEAETPPAAFDPVNNPYIADSAFHRPVGTGAEFAGSGHSWTVSWLRWRNMGGPNVNRGFPFGRPYAVVDDGSPLISVFRSSGYDGTYNIPTGGLHNVPAPAEGIPFLQGFTGRAGDDMEMSVINEVSGEIQSYRGVDQQPGYPNPFHRWNAGAMFMHWARRNGDPDIGRTSGLGHGLFPGDRVSPGASGVGSQFGVIRANEIAGTEPIRHAWQIALPRLGRQVPSGGPAMLGPTFMLPATSRDSDGANNTGSLPYGVVVAIPSTVNLGSLGLSAAEMRIAISWRDFGIIPVDGAGAVAFRGDQYLTTAQRSLVTGTFTKVADHMRPIINSAWLPEDRRRPTGGGDPIAENGAFDA